MGKTRRVAGPAHLARSRTALMTRRAAIRGGLRCPAGPAGDRHKRGRSSAGGRAPAAGSRKTGGGRGHTSGPTKRGCARRGVRCKNGEVGKARHDRCSIRRNGALGRSSGTPCRSASSVIAARNDLRARSSAKARPCRGVRRTATSPSATRSAGLTFSGQRIIGGPMRRCLPFDIASRLSNPNQRFNHLIYYQQV